MGSPIRLVIASTAIHPPILVYRDSVESRIVNIMYVSKKAISVMREKRKGGRVRRKVDANPGWGWSGTNQFWEEIKYVWGSIFESNLIEVDCTITHFVVVGKWRNYFAKMLQKWELNQASWKLQIHFIGHKLFIFKQPTDRNRKLNKRSFNWKSHKPYWNIFQIISEFAYKKTISSLIMIFFFQQKFSWIT